MPERLPRNMSPRARKHLLASDAGAVVRVMAEVGPSADEAELRGAVARLGGEVRSWSGESRSVVVELPAAQLGTLARLSGIVYVEAEEPYRH